MLDSDLFLPKDGWSGPERHEEAEIPPSVVYSGKHFIALEHMSSLAIYSPAGVHHETRQ